MALKEVPLEALEAVARAYGVIVVETDKNNKEAHGHGEANNEAAETSPKAENQTNDGSPCETTQVDNTEGDDSSSKDAPQDALNSATRREELLKGFQVFAETYDPWKDLCEAHVKDIDRALDELEEEEIETGEELTDILQDTENTKPRHIRVLDSACSVNNTLSNLPPGRHQLVALDLSENATDCVATPMEMGFPWLRKLSIGSSSISTPLNLQGLWRLVILDISYIQTGDNSAIDFAPLADTLRRLVADGCGWKALPPSISKLAILQVLSAQENELTPAKSVISVLAPLAPNLYELDLRENPFQDSASCMREYHELVNSALPGLKLLDNQYLRSEGADIALKDVPHLREDLNRHDTVIDANEDRASCSCLEGTACVDEYSCKDWHHREEIAAYVREHGTPPPPRIEPPADDGPVVKL